MGKQKNISLRGRWGNLIYYNWQGIDCVRTVPSYVAQTPATKSAGNYFGKANKTEKQLRNTLLQIIPNIKDKDMQRRFCKALYKWLLTQPLNTSLPANKLPYITGYD